MTRKTFGGIRVPDASKKPGRPKPFWGYAASGRHVHYSRFCGVVDCSPTRPTELSWCKNTEVEKLLEKKNTHTHTNTPRTPPTQPLKTQSILPENLAKGRAKLTHIPLASLGATPPIHAPTLENPGGFRCPIKNEGKKNQFIPIDLVFHP